MSKNTEYMQHYEGALLKATISTFDLIIYFNVTKSEYNILRVSEGFLRSGLDSHAYDDLLRQGLKVIPDEIFRKKFHDLFSRDAVLKAYQNGQKTVSLRYPQLTHNGIRFWMESNLAISENEDGDVIAINMSRHVDEMDDVQSQIERNEMALRMVNYASFDFDIASGKLHLSENFEQIFGCSIDEQVFLDPAAFRKIFPIYPFDQMSVIFHDLLEAKTVQVIDTPINVPAGQRWCRISMVPYIDGLGKVKNILGVLSDNTLQHINMQQMEKLLSVSSGLVYRCLLGPKAHLEYVSSSAAMLFGYTRDEFAGLFGEDLSTAINPDDREVYKNFIEKLSVEPGTGTCYYSITCRDGSIKYVSDAMESVLNADGTMHGYSTITDITEIMEYRLKMEDELKIAINNANRDPLTGLLNKNAFKEEAKKFLAECKPYISSVIFIDMDSFKSINDTLGHEIGDLVIKDAARKLRLAFANCDLIARYGGDEFIIYASDIPEDTLRDRLSFLTKKIASSYSNNGKSVDVSASMGCVITSDPNVDFETMMSEADHLMYASKQEGKNRFTMKRI